MSATKMTIQQLENRKTALLSIRIGINALLQDIQRDIQQQCQHAFKLNQVAGTGQTCTKCGLWDLNCDD